MEWEGGKSKFDEITQKKYFFPWSFGEISVNYVKGSQFYKEIAEKCEFF